MITKFKIYESDFRSYMEGKFFFRPTNGTLEHGNLCLCLGAYSTYQPGKDHQIDIVNIQYNKNTKDLYRKIGKKWIETKTLYYSHSTFDRLKFLTAEELFEQDEELIMNIFYYVNREKDKVSLFRAYVSLYDALSKSNSINRLITIDKYNL